MERASLAGMRASKIVPKIFQVNGEPLIVPYRAVAQPDTTACIFWLKNRRPDRWRDVHKHEHGGPNTFDQMSDDERREYIAEETKAMKMSMVRMNGGSGNGTKH
jgi:hypothetical protein